VRAHLRGAVARWPTLDTLWLLALPACLMFLLDRQAITSNDFWWHLRTGQIIVSTRTIPTTDLFSFTRSGAPWANQAWLMQVWLYLVYAAGGPALSLLAHSLIVTAGYTIAMASAARYYGTRAAAIAAFTAAALGLLNWNVRPQGFSFLAFGVLVALVESHRHGSRTALWAAPPLFALWSNCHGAFIFGMAYLGLYAIGQTWDGRRSRASGQSNPAGLAQLWAVAGLSLAALSLNPLGPMGTLRYVLGFARSRVTVEQNLEFAPLSVRQLDGMLLALAVLALLVVLFRTAFHPATDQWLALALFTLAGAWARRNLPWCGFVLMPVLAGAVARAWPARRAARPGVTAANWALALAMLALVLVTLPSFRPLFPPNVVLPPMLTNTPQGAVDYMCRNLPANARVFEDQAFASYQIWACPRLKVFVDTRIELYPWQQWQDYLAISGARYDWESLLASYGLSYLCISTKDANLLVRAATASGRYTVAYRDDTATVLAPVCP